MAAFADRPCGTLSSGQKQRANIARAFLHDPPLLILDEPTNALDVISGQFIVQAIRQARDAGRAMLFSTHIMGEAEYLCDRIVLIHQGRVVDAGPLPDLLARSGRTQPHRRLPPLRRRVGGLTRMRLSIVGTILFKELRETLRDRRTLLLTVGLPVLLYPMAILGFARIAESGEDAIEAGRSSVAVWGTLPAADRAGAGPRREPHADAVGRGRRTRSGPAWPAAGCRRSRPPATTRRRSGRAGAASASAARPRARTRCSPRPARWWPADRSKRSSWRGRAPTPPSPAARPRP